MPTIAVHVANLNHHLSVAESAAQQAVASTKLARAELQAMLEQGAKLLAPPAPATIQPGEPAEPVVGDPTHVGTLTPIGTPFNWTQYPATHPKAGPVPKGMLIWTVEAFKVTRPDGTTITTNDWGGSLLYPLARALREIEKFGHTDTVGVRIIGAVNGAMIGAGNVQQQHTVPYRVHDVHIFGGDLDAEILGGVQFAGRVDQGLGWENVVLHGLLITAEPHAIAPVQVFEDAHGGLIGLLKCRLRPHQSVVGDMTIFGGWGCRFGFRAEGQCRALVVECDFSCGFEEHCVYLDNLQGDSVLAWNVWGPTTRTRAQITTRRKAPWNPAVTHAPSFGHLLICDHETNATHWGSGGAAYTIAGHLGPVTLSTLVDDPEGAQCHGGVAIWQDLEKNPDGSWTKGEPYLDGDGFAVGPVRILGGWFKRPNADRACVVASACRELLIDTTYMDAGELRAGLHVNHQGDQVAQIGRIFVVGSTATKVKVGDDSKNPPFLTHDQKVALFAGTPVPEVLKLGAAL